MKTYHFGVPKIAVWLLHIVLGIYFTLLGYSLLDTRRIHGVVLIVLGALQTLYHAHIWYSHTKEGVHNH